MVAVSEVCRGAGIEEEPEVNQLLQLMQPQLVRMGRLPQASSSSRRVNGVDNDKNKNNKKNWSASASSGKSSRGEWSPHSATLTAKKTSTSTSSQRVDAGEKGKDGTSRGTSTPNEEELIEIDAIVC